MILNGHTLNVDQALAFLHNPTAVRVCPEALQRVKASHLGVESTLRGGSKRIYGFHTGLGRLKEFLVEEGDQAQFQTNILNSHAAGIGPYFNDDICRLSMLIRANVLLQGYSGVRPDLVERIMLFLQRGLKPMMRQIGSLGVGDLQPMAQLGLCLVGSPQGELKYQGQVGPADETLRRAGIEPVEFGLDRLEALALLSGSTVQLATCVWALGKARDILRLANAALALSLEAFRGEMDAYDPRVHLARGVPGQISAASAVRAMVNGSRFTSPVGRELFEAGPRVQDPVSYRAAPQVHGACGDVLVYIESVLQRALNAASDNPLFFEQADGTYEGLSGGNFHGAGMGYCMDFAAVVLTDLAVLSERRSARLLDPHMSHGLPMNLVAGKHGMNTGFALVQSNAVALVSEMRVLATPSSVGSIPSKSNQEDHNSLGMTAARKCLQILEAVEMTMAIEILCACQAIDLIRDRAPGLQLGDGTALLHQRVRAQVPKMEQDSYTGKMLLEMVELAQTSSFLDGMPEL